MMLMDLDGFKEVNDTLGHHTGDSLLQKISVALVRAVGAKGLVARLGGDEFAIVIPNLASRADVATIARETLTAAEAPVLIDGLALEVRASLGVALAPDHGDVAAALLRQADIAMYQAKTSRSGVELYDSEEDHYTTRRLILVSELSRAMQTSALQAALPAQSRAEHRSHHRCRGAPAVDPSAVRDHPARRVHPGGRAVGAHPPPHSLGPADGVGAGRGLEPRGHGPDDGRQPVGPQRRRHRTGRRGRRAHRPRRRPTVGADAGADRVVVADRPGDEARWCSAG